MKNSFPSVSILASIPLLSGCVMAGGYSSNGGWFFWPGSWIGILIMLGLAITSFFFWRP